MTPEEGPKNFGIFEKQSPEPPFSKSWKTFRFQKAIRESEIYIF